MTNDFPPSLGGIERFTVELARHLPGAAVLAPWHDDAEATDAALPFPVLRAGTEFMLPTARSLATIHRAADEHDADVVVLMSPWPLGVLGPDLDRQWTVIAHGAELTVPSRLPALGALLRRRLTEAPGLFAVSEHTAAQLRTALGLACPPIRLVRNGVLPETFRPDVDGLDVRRRHGLGEAPVLGCVGRLVPRKGQDRLIEALPAIRAAVDDVRLLLVGDGRLRRQLARASRDLPEEAVALVGPVDGAALPEHFAAMDVFAHPNRSRWFGLEQEGFGVIFLEAQASGLPVIAGRSGGAPEAMIDGETGRLVDGDDVEEIAAAAIELLSDPALARGMGRAGRRLVEERFAWPRVAEAFHADLARLGSGPDADASAA